MADLRVDLDHLLQTGGPAVEPFPLREFVIYGAGHCGRAVAAAAIAADFRVLAFLDARADDVPEVDGIRCGRLDSPVAHWAAGAGLPVVVAIFNYATDLRPIFLMLREAGFARVVSLGEFNELVNCAPRFWLAQREFYQAQRAEILAGFDLMEDERSQQTYFDYLALRMTFDLERLSEPDIGNQYAPVDLPALKMPMRLIDGGAYTGDTLESFLGKGVEFEAVAAFEPDLENFRELGATIRRASDRLGDLTLMPCGLSSETAMRKFSAGRGTGSSLRTAIEDWLSPSEHTHISVVALDDVLPTFRPTFVKLDIEGAEPQALEGAARLLKRARPTLAVCVYHEPDHLWTIPQLVRRLCPDHRLALRYHYFNGLEVVLYAFPAA